MAIQLKQKEAGIGPNFFIKREKEKEVTLHRYKFFKSKARQNFCKVESAYILHRPDRELRLEGSCLLVFRQIKRPSRREQ